MFKKLFCKHDWEKQVEKLIPSIVNTTPRLGKSSVDRSWFVRTHILILSCKKCGKISKNITKC